MNQRALSTVILRILGILFIYLTISQVSQGYLLSQGFAMMDDDSESGSAFMKIISVSLVTQALLGLLLCTIADRISAILFKENNTIIFEGSIDGRSLLSVGIGLIGIYILANNFPGFIESGFQWFKTRASATTIDDQLSAHGPFALHSTIMVITGFILAARRSSISRLMGSHQKNGEQNSADNERKRSSGERNVDESI